MLAGVTDDFGRVTLLDLARGVCIRMWKGEENIKTEEKDMRALACVKAAFYLFHDSF